MPCGCRLGGHRWVAGPEASLGMSGLPVAVSPDAHWLRRLLWILLLMLSSSWLIVQLHGSVERLLDQKITTSSQYEQLLTVPFPAVTICSVEHFKEDQILKMTEDGTTINQWKVERGPTRYRLLRWSEVNFDEFFDRASFKYSDIVDECLFHSRPCDEVGNVTTTVTSRHGACHTIVINSPTEGTWTTPQLEISLKVPTSNRSQSRSIRSMGWNAILHHPSIPFTDTTMFAAFSFSQLFLPGNVKTLVKTHRRDDSYISRDDDPCSDDASDIGYANCIKKCIREDSRVQSSQSDESSESERNENNTPHPAGKSKQASGEEGDPATCCLPWERRNQSGPPCTSYKELVTALRRSADLHSLDESELYDIGYDCRCVSPCSRVSFPAETPDRLEMSKPNASNTGRLGLWMSMRIENRREEWSFTFPQFVAECGGNMGIFLGASLLSFVEVVDVLVFWVLRKLEKKHNKVTGIFVTSKRGSLEDMTTFNREF